MFKKILVAPSYIWILAAAIFWLALLPLCSDWAGFIVDEGFTLYGAMRWAQGEIPHRDFFFLWTPGNLFFQKIFALLPLPAIWAGRIATLGFCLAILAALSESAKRMEISLRGQAFILCSAILWGFSHWNMPYASWPAIALTWWAILQTDRRFWLAGLLWALSFWFKQNIAILSFCGFFLLRFIQGERHSLRIISCFYLLGLLPGFLYFFITGAGKQFIQQIFLFPLTYREAMYLGLPWGDFRSARFFFWLLPFASFIAIAAAWFKNKKWDSFTVYFLAASLGIYAQVYPRLDFQHFLFVFPLAILWFVWAIERLAKPLWTRLAFLLGVGLIASGLFYGAQGIAAVLWPENILAGVRSRGLAAKYNAEIKSVENFLSQNHWQAGDPLLVLPHEETLYYLLGAKNPLPHNQFLPSYLEAFGDKPENALTLYREKGGRWVILGYAPVLEQAYPGILRDLSDNFILVQKLPYYFSIWRAKN